MLIQIDRNIDKQDDFNMTFIWSEYSIKLFLFCFHTFVRRSIDFLGPENFRNYLKYPIYRIL